LNYKLILEKLESIYEYDKNFFTWDTILKNMWNDILKDSMKKFKIYFDLENNDTCNAQKEIVIPQDYWDNVKCKFRCELFQAGGDWEIPVYYFKIQLVEGYCFDDDFKLTNSNKIYSGRMPHTKNHFVYIPGKTNGNYHLVSKNGGDWFAPHDGVYKENVDPKPNEKDCWKSLENYLKELVDKEIKIVKK
jgi:hypothetical protein